MKRRQHAYPYDTRDKHLSGLCSVEPQIVVGGPVSDTLKLLLKCGPHASSNDEVSVVRKFEKVISVSVTVLAPKLPNFWFRPGFGYGRHSHFGFGLV